MSKELVVKIREQDLPWGERGSFEYKNKIQLKDFHNLALFFSDLEKHGANIEKAFREFIEQKEEGKFPF